MRTGSERGSAGALVILALVGSGEAAANDGNKLVRAEFLADPAAAVPRQPQWIAIRYTIEPGWHIYWENPGDSGMATRIELKPPPGWTVGETLFPGPEKHLLPGGLVNYGYEGEAALLVQLTPPSTAKPGESITLPWSTDWLVCREQCLKGRAEGLATIAVKPATEARKTGVLAPWLDRLPATPDEMGLAWAAWWTEGASKPTWNLRIEGQADVFFPTRGFEEQGIQESLAAEGTGTRLTAVRTGNAEDCRPARGLLRLPGPPGPRYLQVDVPCS